MRTREQQGAMRLTRRPNRACKQQKKKKGGGHPGHDKCRRLSFPSVAAPRGTLEQGLARLPRVHLRQSE